MSTTSKLAPYEAGRSLELRIVQSSSDPIPQSQETVTVNITRLITETMSPVMKVTFGTECGSTSAILKLYDRRFGTHFRDLDGKYSPCRDQDEAAYQLFLQEGKMGPFLEELEDKKNSIVPPSPWCYYYEEDSDDPLPDGVARFEAALWYEANQYFKNETKAYGLLQESQGKSVPRMYAHVRLTPPSIDSSATKDPDSEDYLLVHGVLMEFIPGFNLMDLAKFLPTADLSEWSAIAQHAVDAVHDINKRGIILLDSGPRNAMVDESTKNPFIIDLAQCYFKDELIELWEEMGLKDYEKAEDELEDEGPWHEEIEYWRHVRSHQNPASVGLVLNQHIKKMRNVELKVNYPNYAKIIADTRDQLINAEDQTESMKKHAD
ncbi:hypothetical protein FGRMN_9515 [Fusarium graminum]|nr:hypothetical protein FGRMN_9515 [Fusarium graminum]